ncbi:30S ribosomal protein S5 [bacterium AB1]|nr:30S ribosomal protein S5 [bacterium AB1]
MNNNNNNNNNTNSQGGSDVSSSPMKSTFNKGNTNSSQKPGFRNQYQNKGPRTGGANYGAARSANNNTTTGSSSPNQNNSTTTGSSNSRYNNYNNRYNSNHNSGNKYNNNSNSSVYKPNSNYKFNNNNTNNTPANNNSGNNNTYRRNNYGSNNNFSSNQNNANQSGNNNVKRNFYNKGNYSNNNNNKKGSYNNRHYLAQKNLDTPAVKSIIDKMKDKKEREQQLKSLYNKVLLTKRISKTVKGGKNMSFYCLTVVGNTQGSVGIGSGKAKSMPDAIDKSLEQARLNMITPQKIFNMKHKKGATEIIISNKKQNILSCPYYLSEIFIAAGIYHVSCKLLTSRNKMNAIFCLFDALKQMNKIHKIQNLKRKAIEEKSHTILENK